MDKIVEFIEYEEFYSETFSSFLDDAVDEVRHNIVLDFDDNEFKSYCSGVNQTKNYLYFGKDRFCVLDFVKHYFQLFDIASILNEADHLIDIRCHIEKIGKLID